MLGRRECDVIDSLCDPICTKNISILLNTVLITSSICLSVDYPVILSISLCQYFNNYFFFSYSLLRSLIISTFLSRFLYWRRLFVIPKLSPPPILISPSHSSLSLSLTLLSITVPEFAALGMSFRSTQETALTEVCQSVSQRAWRAHLHLNHLTVPCPFSFYCLCIFISASSIRLHCYQIVAFFVFCSPFFPLLLSLFSYDSFSITYIIPFTHSLLTHQILMINSSRLRWNT